MRDSDKRRAPTGCSFSLPPRSIGAGLIFEKSLAACTTCPIQDSLGMKKAPEGALSRADDALLSSFSTNARTCNQDIAKLDCIAMTSD